MPVDLPITLEKLEEVGNSYGTPFQLYDETKIRENAQSLIHDFQKNFHDFQQFFAVKALPNPSILKILIDEGCGLDCSSLGELYIAKKLNVSGDKVMYTSNYTSKEDLAVAFDQGVIINLDDISLIDHLVEVRGKCPELISFRLNPGIGRTDSETESNVLGGPNAKFGVPPFQIVDAYRKAKEAGSTRFGIHMMTGSCVMNSEYWKETVSILFETIGKIRKELNIEFEFMNIGGGLGIPYRHEEKRVNTMEISNILKQIFDRAQKNLTMTKMPRLCMENGRYMTGPYGWLVSRCQAIKNSYACYYGLDACMAHLMRPGMYNAYHHITIPAKEGGNRKKANVVGNLCENNDWFASQRDLPEADVGDLFVIYDTGAHSHSMGFQYNAKPRAPEILLRQDGSCQLIRERETVESLYANCIIPKDL